jgi:hypothetical protein
MLNETSPDQKTVLNRTSPYQLHASADGTFQVAFSRLDSGVLPLGFVTVNASAAGSGPVSTQFMIIPPGPPGGGAPPTG